MDRIGRLFEAHARRLWGLARALTRSAEDADDLVQQTFTIAITKRAEIPDDAWPWLAKVASFSARNQHRHRARRQGMEDVHEAEVSGREPDPAEAAGKRELIDSLHAALCELSHDEREALALCHLSGLTQSQACVIVGVELNTLKARVRRGMQHLQEKLKLTEASAFAMLTGFSFPPPAGGWDQAISRWESRAWGATEVAPSPVAFSGIKLFACAALASLVGVGAWLAVSAQDADMQQKRNAEVGSTSSGGGFGAGQDAVVKGPPSNDSVADAARGDPVKPENPEGKPVEKTGATPEEAAPPKDAPREARLGELQTRRTYYANGRLESEWTEWVTPGKSIKQGRFTNYWPNGLSRESGEYREDLREGSWTYHHEDGTRFVDAEYLHNQPHGLWKVYDEKGNPESEGRYENGEHVGEWLTLHPNGQKALIQNFEHDKLNGVETEFDEQGRRRRETHWLKGKRHGLETIWDEAGEVVSSKMFNQGK